MPREIVHWAVLEKSRAVLRQQGQSLVAAILDSQLPYAYLGAMVPDAPYYHHLGGSSFEAVAEMIHGTFGEDTFDPIRKATSFLLSRGERNIESLWALLLGAVSHQACDIIFHPLVYYFTGDYYHPDPVERQAARTRHRIFEVYLDQYFLRRHSLLNQGLMSRTINRARANESQVYAFLGEAFPDFNAPASSVNLWKESFSTMKWCQRLFVNQPVGGMLHLLNWLSGERLAPFESLVSYGRGKVPKLFQGVVQYKNPVSGSERSFTLEAEFNRACTKTVEMLALFEPVLQCWKEGRSLEEPLAGVQGLSLNFGEYRVGPEAAKFYANTWPRLDAEES